jgi:hypothetical protein
VNIDALRLLKGFDSWGELSQLEPLTKSKWMLLSLNSETRDRFVSNKLRSLNLKELQTFGRIN